MEIYIWVISLSALLVLTFFLFKNSAFGGFIKSAFFSGITFTALWLFGLLSVFKIGFNLFTFIFSVVFGLPGITSLLFFNILAII